MNNVDLAVQFFLQIAVILLTCRALSFVAGKIGQPPVVAEMVAGILLGPSFFGLFWPELQQLVFPWDKTQQLRDTQSYLFPAAQIGLALYMFIIGTEFRLDIVRERLRTSLAVSAAGVIVPFVMGAGLGWFFFHYTDLFPAKTSQLEGMLFLGASMCITAFPVLARIIQFKRLTGTPIGTVAIGAGAIDDAAAWCILAVVLAISEGNGALAYRNIFGGIVYTALVLGVVRPLLQRFQRWLLHVDGSLADGGLIFCLAIMSLGAWFTDLIGLHAVFGAFVMGTAMPRGAVTTGLMNKIQPLSVALLLPLFFTYSGLNTRMSLLDSAFLWGMCGLVMFVAIFGKCFACWAAARASGMPNREALGIGILMNARGLMELMIINIGLQRGIISEGLFAALVIMAVVTTLMTSPIFDRLIVSPSLDRLPAGHARTT